MPRGGYRRNSGRKTNAQIHNVRTLLTDTMSEAQWKELFQRLHELALDGNMRAAALLLNYQFGDPHAIPDPAGPPIHIHTIEARLSERPTPAQLEPTLPAPPESDIFIDVEAQETTDDNPDEQPERSPAPIKYGRMRYHGEENDDLMDGL